MSIKWQQVERCEKEAIEGEIEKITNSIFESENERNPVELYSNFSDNTTGIFSGVVMESWPEHKKYGAHFLTSQKELFIKIEKMTINVISRDAAVVYGIYTLTTTDSTGTTMTTNPTWTYVFAKENDNWKIVNFHVSEQAIK